MLFCDSMDDVITAEGNPRTAETARERQVRRKHPIPTLCSRRGAGPTSPGWANVGAVMIAPKSLDLGIIKVA